MARLSPAAPGNAKMREFHQKSVILCKIAISTKNAFWVEIALLEPKWNFSGDYTPKVFKYYSFYVCLAPRGRPGRIYTPKLTFPLKVHVGVENVHLGGKEHFWEEMGSPRPHGAEHT